jgi:hypothetical protein
MGKKNSLEKSDLTELDKGAELVAEMVQACLDSSENEEATTWMIVATAITEVQNRIRRNQEVTGSQTVVDAKYHNRSQKFYPEVRCCDQAAEELRNIESHSKKPSPLKRSARAVVAILLDNYFKNGDEEFVLKSDIESETEYSQQTIRDAIEASKALLYTAGWVYVQCAGDTIRLNKKS